MSETINKRALLGWLQGAYDLAAANFEQEKRDALGRVIAKIKSGRFDEPSDSDLLRVALEFVHGELIGGNIFTQNSLTSTITKIEQALSTTTEPTGAERVREAYKSHSPLHTYGNAYRQAVRDTLRRLGITIPGINAAEEGDKGTCPDCNRIICRCRGGLDQ